METGETMIETIHILVNKVSNGYTVTPSDDFEEESNPECFIAPSREEVAKVVVKICDARFGEPRVPSTGEPGHDEGEA